MLLRFLPLLYWHVNFKSARIIRDFLKSTIKVSGHRPVTCKSYYYEVSMPWKIIILWRFGGRHATEICNGLKFAHAGSCNFERLARFLWITRLRSVRETGWHFAWHLGAILQSPGLCFATSTKITLPSRNCRGYGEFALHMPIDELQADKSSGRRTQWSEHCFPYHPVHSFHGALGFLFDSVGHERETSRPLFYSIHHEMNCSIKWESNRKHPEAKRVAVLEFLTASLG